MPCGRTSQNPMSEAFDAEGRDPFGIFAGSGLVWGLGLWANLWSAPLRAALVVANEAMQPGAGRRG